MGDVDLVWVRSYSVNGRDAMTLARESALDKPLTAADVREILGDEPPVVAYDDSGPGGAIIFPADERRQSRHPLDLMLAEQLRTAIWRRALTSACPAESFPEPGDVADDFAEPVGGEGARVAAEEAAHDAALKAAAAPPAAEPVDNDRAAFHYWRSGDRFEVLNRDDVARAAAASYLWPVWWGGVSAGHVIARCDMHLAGHHTVPGLLIDCEGLSRPTVIAAATLSACARKVTS
jgi:hypothetical protein